MGVVVAALGEAEGVVNAVLDERRLRSVREQNPALGHRRWAVVQLDRVVLD
jgi:predicted amidohydrolase